MKSKAEAGWKNGISHGLCGGGQGEPGAHRCQWDFNLGLLREEGRGGAKCCQVDTGNGRKLKSPSSSKLMISLLISNGV